MAVRQSTAFTHTDTNFPFDAIPDPVELSRWEFPSSTDWDNNDVVCAGGDLETATLITAYSSGLFPMEIKVRGRQSLAWWSPVQRGVLPLNDFKVSRSLKQSIGKYETRVDSCFEKVIEACANQRREGNWINRTFIDAYSRLHSLGWAHSIETFLNGNLVGGLYGVRINGFFAGESMFHTATDASKVALWRLVEEMKRAQMSLLDVQWKTPHLESLGVIEVGRLEYLALLRKALDAPQTKRVVFNER